MQPRGPGHAQGAATPGCVDASARWIRGARGRAARARRTALRDPPRAPHARKSPSPGRNSNLSGPQAGDLNPFDAPIHRRSEKNAGNYACSINHKRTRHARNARRVLISSNFCQAGRKSRHARPDTAPSVMRPLIRIRPDAGGTGRYGAPICAFSTRRRGSYPPGSRTRGYGRSYRRGGDTRRRCCRRPRRRRRDRRWGRRSRQAPRLPG